MEQDGEIQSPTDVVRPYPWRCFSCGQNMVMPATIEYKAKCRQGNKLACFTIPALPISECAGCREQYFSGSTDDVITTFLNDSSVPKEYRDYPDYDPLEDYELTQEQADAIDAASNRPPIKCHTRELPTRKIYRVYQDGKLADESGYPDAWPYWPFANNYHFSFEKAVEYAHKWAYPIPEEKIIFQHMEPNTPVDMSMFEVPVMMEIREWSCVVDAVNQENYPQGNQSEQNRSANWQ